MAEVEDDNPQSGEFELAFLEGIYKRDPDDPKVLTLLATLYTEMGMIDKGLALDLHHVEIHPDDPSAHYDCACSLSLAGRLDQAFEELETALKMEFDSLDWMHKDPDLVAMRCDERWPELMAKYEVPLPEPEDDANDETDGNEGAEADKHDE